VGVYSQQEIRLGSHLVRHRIKKRARKIGEVDKTIIFMRFGTRGGRKVRQEMKEVTLHLLHQPGPPSPWWHPQIDTNFFSFTTINCLIKKVGLLGLVTLVISSHYIRSSIQRTTFIFKLNLPSYLDSTSAL